MPELTFTLKPFPAAHLPRVTLTGRLVRLRHALALRFVLIGHLADLALPHPAASPARRHGLWQETCFEIFLAAKDEPAYWEVNLTPAGHWNVFRFAGYRQGMEEEPSISALPCQRLRRPQSLTLTVEMALPGGLGPVRDLEAGISAVLKSMGGELTYWALTHPGSQPDFHRRDSFLLRF